MLDIAETRGLCRKLAARLEGRPRGSELPAVYLDLVSVVGRLQGAVSEAGRTHGQLQEALQAEQLLAQLKASMRKVGLDIRLASEAALLIGLQTSLQSAFETLDWLERVGGG